MGIFHQEFNNDFTCKNDLEIDFKCSEQCGSCKIYYTETERLSSYKDLRKIKVGKKIKVRAKRETIYTTKNGLASLSIHTLQEGGIIQGVVVSVNKESGEIVILTPDGIEKTINIFNFIVKVVRFTITILPLIKELIEGFKDLFRPSKQG